MFAGIVPHLDEIQNNGACASTRRQGHRVTPRKWHGAGAAPVSFFPCQEQERRPSNGRTRWTERRVSAVLSLEALVLREAPGVPATNKL